jgi:hypothetical protein
MNSGTIEQKLGWDFFEGELRLSLNENFSQKEVVH